MARNENGSGFSLKDELFNSDKVAYLADLFARADPRFDADSFSKKVMSQLHTLELKARISWIATVLEEQLPSDFVAAAAVIERSLPPPLDPSKTDNDFGDFIFAPLGEYVVRNGRKPALVQVSLQTLEAITQRFSMEDAIRYFLNDFEEETLAKLQQWTTHRHYHVRRLVSEGTRPLLPWSGRLSMSYKTALPLLDELYFDPTRYVTRSVANHLNDIAKVDSELVVTTLKRWQRSEKQDPEEMDWIIRHSVRTLIKQGDVAALALLGYSAEPPVALTTVVVATPVVARGTALQFSCTVTAKKPTRLLVDYVIDFYKANGTHSPKVFKLKQVSLAAGEAVTLTKTHPFLKAATTRVVYPGEHRLSIQINGKQHGGHTFVVT